MSAFSKARIDQLRALRNNDPITLDLLDEVERLQGNIDQALEVIKAIREENAARGNQ